ncbi:MAG: hypothetical protein IAG13_26755 [Deltaproteobacteria bacterium]|nr:hypothetical protein [Nannocystaceae bacterium]
MPAATPGAATPAAALPSWLVAPSSTASGEPGGEGQSEPIDFALRRRPPTGEPPAILEDTLEGGAVVTPATEWPAGSRPNGAGDPFAELARGLVEGSLCVVRGYGHGERVARCLGNYALLVDRREAEGRRFDAALATFVVRVEDPSELLGWILRRVEEGARVIVELGARTAEGARHCLLGVGSGAHAAAWLDAVPRFWCSHDDAGRWSLTRG